MEIAASRKLVSDTRSEFELHHLTDLHMDDKEHAGKELAARIERIKNNDRALWLGGGDYSSLILPGDPRGGDGWGDDVPPDRVPDWAVETTTELLMPIRDKCIGFGLGNHERTIQIKYHRGVVAEIAKNLSIPHLYLGMRGWAPVTFEKELPNKSSKTSQTLKVYWYHGWSAGRSKSRKVLQEERDMGARGAHVHMVGHDHQPWISSWYQEDLVFDARNRCWKIRHSPVCFMNGGAWTYGQEAPDRKKLSKDTSEFGNSSWAEGKNYRPEPPRSPILHVEVDFGRSKKANRRDSGRGMGFGFREEMESPVFFPGTE